MISELFSSFTLFFVGERKLELHWQIGKWFEVQDPSYLLVFPREDCCIHFVFFNSSVTEAFRGVQ
jgi:hypothetical protein